MITRLDTTSQSDFLLEIRSCFEVRECLALINTNLDKVETECTDFKKQFDVYAYLWQQNPQQQFEKFLDENEPKDEKKENDQEDSMSLKDNPLLKGCRVKIPNLDLFDEKVTMLKNIQQEIQKIQTPKQIFWLRIDLKPMMTNLESKVIQWIKVYTDFLVHQFKTTLKNLQEFIAVTNEGVANNPSAEENRDNRDLLMSVMQVISQVNDIGQIEWLIQR